MNDANDPVMNTVLCQKWASLLQIQSWSVTESLVKKGVFSTLRQVIN